MRRPAAPGAAHVPTRTLPETRTMYVVFGHTLYGKTDIVPGFFHVATRFAHLYYIPLFPVGSYLVVSQRGGKFNGVPIPMSGKSVLLAWGRAALGVVAGIATIVGLIDWADPKGTNAEVAGACIVAGSAFALLTMSYVLRQLTHASPDRAFALANKAGVTAAGLDQLRQHFNLADGYSSVHAFPVLLNPTPVTPPAPPPQAAEPDPSARAPQQEISTNSWGA